MAEGASKMALGVSEPHLGTPKATVGASNPFVVPPK